MPSKRCPTFVAPSIEPLEARIAPAAAVPNLASLNGNNGFQINGGAGDGFSRSVSAAGDINADGFGDLIIGAPFTYPFGYVPNPESGASYVVFGKAGGFAADLNVSTLDGSNGFQINGEADGDFSGGSVSAAGDVNGDGFGDLIISAGSADSNGVNSGASYVVFGKAGGFTANLNLSTLDGSNGFKINGEAAGDVFGRSVSVAGDVNGDGFGDVIIGATLASSNGVHSGASYVVFGKAGGFTANLNVSTLNGSNGFKINGEAVNDGLGVSVSAAGDVNGDGFGDVIMGAHGADPNGIPFSGASYVVFGKAGGFAASLNLSTLDGGNGFRINGEADGDFFGRSVSAAGDVNGDGFGDVIIGAPTANPNGSFSGSSYVVFGKAGTFVASLNLSTLDGSNGFKINGAAAEDGAGVSVSEAGDFNGDGFGDVIIGAYSASPNGFRSGASYVVFGKAGGFAASLNLSALDGGNGFRINGEAANNYSGGSVSAGDINGDGSGDLIIGAFGPDPNGNSSGPSYVVFGVPPPTVRIANASSGEGNGDPRSLDFVVKLSSAALRPITLTFDTVDGTAIGALTEGVNDYLSQSGQALVFGIGEMTKVISIPINGDAVFEGDETFAVTLSNPINATIAAATATGTILDDDSTSPGAHTFVLSEPDGDLVSFKLSLGALTQQDITLAADGSIESIDLRRFAEKSANAERPLDLTIAVKPGPGGGGDGTTNVGFINAAGLDLGNVVIEGNLGRIVVGHDLTNGAALRSLNVASLGTDDPVSEPLVSELHGGISKLNITADVRGAAVMVDGKLKKVVVGGDLVGDTGGGAALLAALTRGGNIVAAAGTGGIPIGAFTAGSVGSFNVKGNMNGGSVGADGDIGSVNVGNDLNGGAIAAGGQVERVKVFGKLKSDDPTQPAVVAALAKIASAKAAGSIAIDRLEIRGDVENAQILLGYKKGDLNGDIVYNGKNPDASSGEVVIGGNWVASSLVAGVFDATADGFGQNDQLIEGDVTERIVSRIASLVIKGIATGSATAGDHFGIVAQEVGKLSINGEKIVLNKDAKDDVLLDQSNGDFRLLEV